MFLVGLVVVFIGIFFMIYYPVVKSRNKRRIGHTMGTCVYIDEEELLNEDPAMGSTIKHYSFIYNVMGRQYTVRLHSIPGDPQLGQQVGLVYNPNNPRDAGYNYGDKAKDYYILLVGIGVFIFGVILMIL